jgi:hypothetical protein
MPRTLFTCAIVCLTAVAVSAADPKVDSAISVFQQVGNDQGKLKIYCEMSDVGEPEGDAEEPAASDNEKEDPAVEAKIEGYLNQLGPDFEAAWDTSEETDENSADGKRLSAALNALEDKCPE